MTQMCELLFEEIFFETFVKWDGFQIAFFKQLDIMRARSRQRSLLEVGREQLQEKIDEF